MSSSLRNHPPNPPPAAAEKSGLTVSKVVAGAGAAATTAVVGSAFGADGTVVGAAVGSIVSAVASVAYERSFDRTRKVVVARVRPVRRADDATPGHRALDATQVIEAEVTQVIPAQQAAPADRVGAPLAPVPPRRRTRLPILAAATAAIFLLGLLAVTGVELLKGGPVLSSQQGTSVGRVLGGSSPSTTTAATATPEASSATATASATPTPSGESEAGPLGEASAAPSKTAAARRTTTTTPTSSAPRAAG